MPFQGLLIPWPAAGHGNPDLSDRAACPGAANPPACDVRLTELTSLPGRAPAQRPEPQAGPRGGRVPFGSPLRHSNQGAQTCCTCSLHRGGGRRACVSWAHGGLGPCLSREREIAVLEQNELLKTCISFGGKCQNTLNPQSGRPGWMGSIFLSVPGVLGPEGRALPIGSDAAAGHRCAHMPPLFV